MDYVPVDFDAYSIRDQNSTFYDLEVDAMLGPMENKEKVWRISSLTASVDDDTKIMILPLPESKRAVKISETQYQLQSYKDFANLEQKQRSSL